MDMDSEENLILKLNKYVEMLQSDFIERNNEAKLIAASIITHEPLVMIGDPGTAKSSIAEKASSLIGIPKEEEENLSNYLNEVLNLNTNKKITKPKMISDITNKVNSYYGNTEDYRDIVKDIFKVYKLWTSDQDKRSELIKELITLASNNYFFYQLNKNTDISELVGSPDLEELLKGRQETFKNHSIISSNIVILDEIYKSSGSIRNSLLSIMNERYFSMDGKRVDSHVWSIIGTSNEIDESEEAEAFNDRFTFKVFVSTVSKENTNKLFVTRKGKKVSKMHVITNLDLININKFLNQIVNEKKEKFETIKGQDEEINTYKKMEELVERCEEKHILVSDRKKTKLINFMCINAILEGRTNLTDSDINILEYVIPHNKEELGTVHKLIGLVTLSKEEVNNELNRIKEGISSYEEELHKFELEKDKSILKQVENKIINKSQLLRKIDYYKWLYDDGDDEDCKKIVESCEYIIKAYDEMVKHYETLSDNKVEQKIEQDNNIGEIIVPKVINKPNSEDVDLNLKNKIRNTPIIDKDTKKRILKSLM